MVERLRIARMGHRGDGVADTPNGPVYAPYTLPGEIVEAEIVPGHPDRRHLIRVETPSAERIAPVCKHFGVCGGCAVQHWRMPIYYAWKRSLVERALAEAGLEAPVDDIVDAHGEGRRRAVFHARRGTHDVLDVGFAALRAHHIVAIDRCPILAPSLHGAIQAAWAIAETLEPARKPLDLHVTATDNGMDIDVRGSGPLRPAVSAALAQLAEARKLARLTRHGELIAQRAPPTIVIGRTKVTLPPGAFLQATEAGETALWRLVQAAIGAPKSVLDLFAGVGPFALRLAEIARVTAIDSDARAIAALAAAAKTPGLKPVETRVRDLFRRPLVPAELKDADAIVFDPPRQGAQTQAKELARCDAPVIVAVSCNPSTFVRDARLIVDGGYQLARVTPVDQFRYSPHVEIVAQFVR